MAIDLKKPEDIIGENGLLKQLTKAVLERREHHQSGFCSRNGRLTGRQVEKTFTQKT